MDDFSRFILSWDLKVDMAGSSLEDVVQSAVDFTGMTDVPMEDRTVLLSDNGAGYISHELNEYLRQSVSSTSPRRPSIPRPMAR